MSKNPQAKEIWTIDDRYIAWVKTDDNRKHNRFVLVVMSPADCQEKYKVRNIIPLTTLPLTHKTHDKYTYPIDGRYKRIIDDKAVRIKSKAVVNHYQPIDHYFLKECVAVVTDDLYETIVTQLKIMISGGSGYEFEV
jgi:hypothetical protein